jgi:FHA domain-containing protein
MDDAAATHRLELLDADLHHALQAWPLDANRETSLGRARSNDIVVASPLVSRLHARMRFVESCWVIEALSELGVWWRGGLRSRVALEEGVAFALGEHGPRLRLTRVAPLEDDFDAGATMRFRPQTFGVLVLDAARRDREVAEIVETDFFRHLERRAGELRARARADAVPTPAGAGDAPERDPMAGRAASGADHEPGRGSDE